MAKRESGKRQITGRIRLDGGEQISERPELDIAVVGEGGDVLQTAAVGEDGAFALDADAVDRARRVVVTDRQADPADRRRAYVLRPQAFRRAVEAGEITIAARDWSRFLLVRRCVDAEIRRCFPWRFVVEDLIDRVRVLPGAIGPLDLVPLLPIHRCAPVCEGTVEVYRRTCCCRPPVLEPPPPFERPFEPPFDVVPDPFPIPFPEPPFPPVPPGPGPDPAPFDLQRVLLTGGTVDVAKLARLRHGELGRWSEPLFPWCRCGPPVKVADGFVGEGGRIHICWREPLRLLPRNCHDEYAFVVKQHIAGSTVTIYDGPAAGQWFDAGDDITLTSYHPRAVGCREDEFPVPVDGAFVVLQDLGTTPSHRLRTPAADGPDSVETPSAGSGLLDLDAGADYALGGDVALRYHFSEIAGADMQALGARYYRVQWAAANATGDPVGDWETLAVPAWKTWRVEGSDIVAGSHSLGPVTAGAVHDLFHIPFETGAPLVGSEEWQDGQFHAIVPTASKPEGRYLVRIEVFDAAGNRLEPGAEPFTYRRWDTETGTLPVTHGALTHLIRTDNRPVVGDIVDVTGTGTGAGDCKFFEGTAGDTVTIAYRAFHPQAGTPSFLLSYTLRVRRGISGTDATAPLSSTTEAGEGASAADHHIAIGDLLDGEAKCSFAVILDVHARIHNGSSRLSGLDAHDVAAFAVELA